MAFTPSPYLAAKLEALRRQYGGAEFVTSTAFPYAPPAPPEEEPGAFSTLGHYLGMPKQYLVDLPINYASTEPLRRRAEKFLETGDEQYAPIPAGELAKEAYIGRPEPDDSPAMQHTKAVGRALAGRFIDISTDPLNLALMGGAGVLGRVAPLAAKALHVGFAGLMAKGAYDAADAAYQQARKEGWTPAVSEKAGEAAVDAGFLLGSFLPGRARRPEPPTGGALMRRPAVEARYRPPTRGLFEGPEGEVVDAEWVRPIEPPGLGPVPPAIPPPSAPRPPQAPPPLGLPETGVERPQARQGVPVEPTPPQALPGGPPPLALPPGPPLPPPPAPAAVPPRPRTPYEPPGVSAMSQDAVTSAIASIDSQIRIAEAMGLGGEVSQLGKLRQSLSEAYTVQQRPPAAPPRDPYEQPGVAAISDDDAVKMLLKLQQEALDAKSGGDVRKATELDATAESLRAQLKARRTAAVTATPAAAPPGGPAPVAAPPGALAPPVEAGAPVEVRPVTPREPVVPQEPQERVPALVAEQRPGVQALLEQAEGRGEGAGPLAEVIGGPQRPAEITAPPEALTAPTIGGFPVPSPAAPPAPGTPQVLPPAITAPLPGPAGGPLPGRPQPRAPIVVNPAEPLREYLTALLPDDKDRIDRFFDLTSALLPQDRLWTPEDIDFAASRIPGLDDDLVNATKLLVAGGVPAPEPTPEEVAAQMGYPEGVRPGHSIFAPTPKKPPTPQLPPPLEGVQYGLPTFVGAPHVPKAPPAPEPVPEGFHRMPDGSIMPDTAMEAPPPVPVAAPAAPAPPAPAPAPVAAPAPAPAAPTTSEEIIAWAEKEGPYQGFTGDIRTRLEAMALVAAEDPKGSKWTAKQIEAAIRTLPAAPAPAPAVEEYEPAPEEEAPETGPLTPEELDSLAYIMPDLLAEAKLQPSPGNVRRMADNLGVALSDDEAQQIADSVQGKAGAGLTGAAPGPIIPPEEVQGAAVEAEGGEPGLGLGERLPEGAPGVPLPGPLPAPVQGPGVEGGVGEVPGPPAGEVEGGLLGQPPEGGRPEPGGGVRKRTRVREADGGGAGEEPGGEPGGGVGGGAVEAPAPEPPPRAPAPPPEGSLTNNLPDEPITPADPVPAVDLHDLNLVNVPGGLEEGRSWTVKLQDNLAAVRLLKDLEATGRRATADEQTVLSKYVGWGNLPKVFNPWGYGLGGEDIGRQRAEEAQAELQKILTPEEYEAASLSVANAHYTSEAVIRGKLAFLKSLGLSSSQRVLEPAMGIGNYFFFSPAGLKKTGVELDPLTARIAKHLSPSANIIQGGLEQTALPDNFYDLVYSNVPFGKYEVFDPAYRNDRIATSAIHNYFFIKALDKVRPGGIVAFITSRYTMDSKDQSVRKRIQAKADLVAAVRLPGGAFQRNAGTQVITDILVFRKRRQGEEPLPAPWIEAKTNPFQPKGYYGEEIKETDEEGLEINRNAIWGTKKGDFGKILGTETTGRGMHHRDEYMVEGPAPTADEVRDALLGSMKAGGIDPLSEAGQFFTTLLMEPMKAERPRIEMTADQIRAIKPGNLHTVWENGKLKIYERVADQLEEWTPPITKDPAYAETPAKKVKAEKALEALKLKISDYIGLRDAAKELIAAQVDPAITDAEFTAIRKKAATQYEAWKKKHGLLNEERDLVEETDFPNVVALEKDYKPAVYKGKGKERKKVSDATAEMADIFYRRLAGKPAVAEKAESVREAYLITLGERGRLDWDRIAALTGKSVSDAREEARSQGLVYLDPATQELTQAEEYLSGNVRVKLALAEAAAKDDPDLQPNVDALKLVVPVAKGPENIRANLGVGWIAAKYLKDFIGHMAGGRSVDLVEPIYVPAAAAWDIKGLQDVLGKHTTAGGVTWGLRTPTNETYFSAADAIEHILSMQEPRIKFKDRDGNEYFDPVATENAKDLKSRIAEEWKDWLWKDKERSDALVKVFNDTFYGTVPRNFDGSHLTFPGMNTSFLHNQTLYPFQKDSVWMMLQNPNTLVALPVGAGKTFTAIAAIMESRRMGVARKPAVVAPKAVVGQWIRDFKRLYPASQILFVRPEEMTPRSRGRMMSRIATGDYDAVIMTHEGLQKLPMAASTVERMVNEELKVLEQAFEDLLRDKYADFQEQLDPLIKTYLDERMKFGEETAKYQRDPRSKTKPAVAYIPHNSRSRGEDAVADKPLLTIAEWKKWAAPKEPSIFKDKSIKAVLRGQAAGTTSLIKRLARAKLQLKTKVQELIDPSRKDRNITFEQLGLDMLVVDEAHAYKNLFFTSQMERVPGLPQSWSARAYDMYMKARITQDRNGGRGVHFLTGTPLTNTIAEMHVLFRFLDPKWLADNGLTHFDAWARNYATIQTGVEVDTTGAGMRTQARFNKFVNLGSLLRAFRSFTYYKQADDLGIERPAIALNEHGRNAPRTMKAPKSAALAAYIRFLVVRAKRIKDNPKDVRDDFPMLITTDGSKAALDMRLIYPDIPDDPNSKVNKAVEKVFEIWQATKAKRLTQLVFLDMGTPVNTPMTYYLRSDDGAVLRKWQGPRLNLYEDMRKKLVAKGIPREEVEFIHDWQGKEGSETEPAKLYDKMNSGQVRVLFASSQKGGVGVNVQKKLLAEHHMDVPYTPDKLEQREGRIVRQGNENPEVQIYNWVTEGSFDIYRWQLVSGKARMIGAGLSGNLEADEMEDLSATALTADEVIALASDNPLVRVRMETQKKIERLERLYHGWQERRRAIGAEIGTKESVIRHGEHSVENALENLSQRKDDLEFIPQISTSLGDRKTFELFHGYLADMADPAAKAAAEILKMFEDKILNHKPITDKAEITGVIGAILAFIDKGPDFYSKESTRIGTFRGLPLTARRVNIQGGTTVLPKIGFSKNAPIGYEDAYQSQGTWDRAKPDVVFNSLEGLVGKAILQKRLEKVSAELAQSKRELESLHKQAMGEFEYRDDLRELQKELFDVEEKLGLHKQEAATAATGEAKTGGGEEAAGGGGGDGEDPPEEGSPDPSDEGGDFGGDEPPDPPDGPPGTGAQPGDSGWDRRVNNARKRSRRRGRGGTANMGVDPMAFWDAVVLGMNALMNGARRFAAWVASVVSGMGGNSPGPGMLRRIWRVANDWFRTVTGPTRRRYRPASEIPPIEPEDVFGRRGYRAPRMSEEEIRNAAREAALGQGPGPEYGRPGGKPFDADINFNTVKDEGGLRDMQARMVAELERSLGRKARQVRHWAEVRAEAVLAGITEADFRRMVKKGIVTDFSITAGRILRQESAKNVQAKLGRLQELAERLMGADPARRELLEQEALDAHREYLAAVAQYAGVAADTVAAGSEAGRALAAHRMLLESLTPEERFARRLFRGLQPNEQLIAKLTDALARQDHAAIAQIARQVLKPGPVRMAVEYFVNSILSGLATTGANLLGNTMYMSMLTGERALAAQLEKGFRPWLERVLAGTETPQERVGGEAWEMGKQMLKAKYGLWSGLLKAWSAVKNEDLYSAIRGEYAVPAIPGRVGKWIRTPGRILDAFDMGAKAAAMDAEKAAQVLRAAVTEGKRRGWNADQVNQRIRELETNLNRYIEIENMRKAGLEVDRTDLDFVIRNRGELGGMLEKMRHFADVATFRDDVTKLTRYLMMARQTYPWLSFMVPFIKTPERILVAAVRRTPVGLAKTLMNIQQGTISGGVAADRLAAGMLGSIVSGAVYMAAKDGLITGGGPSDPRERRHWEKTGKKPYAVKVGSKWISLARIEPLATTLGFAADLAEASDEKTAGDVWDKLHYSVINNVANKTYLTGLINVAEAFGDPERYGARMQKQLVGALVPNLLASAARAIDPTIRQTDDVGSTLMARVPYASTLLPAKLTGTGEPITRGEDPISRFLSPFRYADEAGPEANLERLFLETGYTPGDPPKQYTIGGRKVMLTADERAIYASYSRRATEWARRLAKDRDWSQLETIQKEEILRRIYRMAHDAARRALYSRVLSRVQAGRAKVIA